MSKESDILSEAQESFKDALEYEHDSRTWSLEDARFVNLGEQWPLEVRRQRELAQRPCLTINRLPSFVRQVVNDARQNKPSIKVSPVDSNADPETAEVISGMIRHIERNSNADVAYDTAVEWAVVGGLGYFTIGVEYAQDSGFEQEIVISRVVSPFSVYGDPSSETADSSDWKVAHQILTGSKDSFATQYEVKDLSSWSEAGIGDEAVDDDKMLRLCRYWRVEPKKRSIVQLSNGGTIYEDEITEDDLAIMSAMGVTVTDRKRTISEPEVRYYILSGNGVVDEGEWAGRFIPIIPVYGNEFWLDGQRYWKSLVRDAVDAQRMFNYWRTASTELVALAPKAPWVGPKGAFKSDAKKWNTAHLDNWPFLQYDGEVPPQRQGFAGPPAAALQEALNAADDIKSITGMYDASLGARSNETSGKAILARQREGDVSAFHFTDNLVRAIRHAGKIILDLIPKVYDTPRIVRVLGLDGEADQVEINAINAANDVTVGRYDVSVTAGPSYTTQREEAASQMIELLRAFPDAAPVIGDLVAKNLDWPGADDIAMRLKAMLPPQIQALEKNENPEAQAAMAQAQQAMQQVEQQAMQLQQAAQQVEAEKAGLDASKSEIKAELARLQSEKAVMQADFKRIQAEIKVMTMEAQQQMGVQNVEAEKVTLSAQLQEALAQIQAQAAQYMQQAAAVMAEMQAQHAAMQAAPKRPRRFMAQRDEAGNLVGGVIEET